MSHVLCARRWNHSAYTMKNSISSAGTSPGIWYQMPASSSVASAILEVPTMPRVVSVSPNCVNSRVTFA